MLLIQIAFGFQAAVERGLLKGDMPWHTTRASISAGRSGVQPHRAARRGRHRGGPGGDGRPRDRHVHPQLPDQGRRPGGRRRSHDGAQQGDHDQHERRRFVRRGRRRQLPLGPGGPRAGEQLGPLKDLPIGIRFVVSGHGERGPVAALLAAGRLLQPRGRPCARGGRPRPPAGAEAPRCNREPVANFVGTEAGGGMVITLLEENTGPQRTVRIAPGGRVLAQP